MVSWSQDGRLLDSLHCHDVWVGDGRPTLNEEQEGCALHNAAQSASPDTVASAKISVWIKPS